MISSAVRSVPPLAFKKQGRSTCTKDQHSRSRYSRAANAMRTSRPAPWAHRTARPRYALTRVEANAGGPRARDGRQVGPRGCTAPVPRGCGRTREEPVKGCDFCVPSARGHRLPPATNSNVVAPLSRWETGPAVRNPRCRAEKVKRHVTKYGPRAAGFVRFCRSFEIRAALRHRRRRLRYAVRKSSTM
jgi:hypothetical protein